MTKNKNNQAIWDIRIKAKTSSIFQKAGSSIDIDKRLYKEDIAASIAHVEMLRTITTWLPSSELSTASGLNMG